MELVPLHSSSNSGHENDNENDDISTAARAFPLTLGRTDLAKWWWKTCPVCGRDSGMVSPCNKCKLVGRNVTCLSKKLLRIDEEGFVQLQTTKNRDLIRIRHDEQQQQQQQEESLNETLSTPIKITATTTALCQLQPGDVLCLGNPEERPWMEFRVQRAAAAAAAAAAVATTKVTRPSVTPDVNMMTFIKAKRRPRHTSALKAIPRKLPFATTNASSSASDNNERQNNKNNGDDSNDSKSGKSNTNDTMTPKPPTPNEGTSQTSSVERVVLVPETSSLVAQERLEKANAPPRRVLKQDNKKPSWHNKDDADDNESILSMPHYPIGSLQSATQSSALFGVAQQPQSQVSSVERNVMRPRNACGDDDDSSSSWLTPSQHETQQRQQEEMKLVSDLSWSEWKQLLARDDVDWEASSSSGRGAVRRALAGLVVTQRSKRGSPEWLPALLRQPGTVVDDKIEH